MEKNEQRKLRHLDLFSGIGGFSLGLESTGGFETVGFCDNEPFAQKVLKKHWPNVPIYEDVRNVGVETIGYRGVDIITGGFPCQSVSVAGLQKATEDDRWLWPEMFRIIKEIRPTYVLGENVRNLVSIRDGVVFEQVCTDLESEGYETKTLILPASSQNAPHLRYRCFIIAVLANSKNIGLTKSSYEKERKRNSSRCSEGKFEGGSFVADTSKSEEHWQWNTGRGLGGTGDGVSKRIHGHWGDNWEEGTPRVAEGQKNRTQRLKALGNSVIPQIPAVLGRAILEVHWGSEQRSKK